MNYPAELVLHNLGEVAEDDISGISEHVHISRNMVHLLGGEDTPLAVFGKQGFSLGGRRNIFPLEKTPASGQQKREFSLREVVSTLESDDMSLNHLGACYQVDDLNQEVMRICDIMKDSVYKVYEDKAGIREGMRWLFVGRRDALKPHTPCLETPMFEIVLPKKELHMRPHVQFDIDTTLSDEEIYDRIQTQFGDNFFDWNLPIEGVGNVLSMGTFDNRWIDLRIGVGNDKRSRKDHRESMVELT